MTIDDCRKSALHCEDLGYPLCGYRAWRSLPKAAEQWREVVKEMEKEPHASAECREIEMAYFERGTGFVRCSQCHVSRWTRTE